MMFANVRLVTDKDTHSSRIYLNGEDISGNVTSVRVKVGCQPCVPEVKVSLLSSPFEYNGDADVKYDFTPDSVNEAARMMRIELAKKGERYEELIRSFEDSLNTAANPGRPTPTEVAQLKNEGYSGNTVQMAMHFVAKLMADRLIGLED